LGLLGASCSVLRIDVDVYKGPIANEEQIQLQELIALAMGAKPLIVNLRDAVEAEERDWTLVEWRSRGGYLDRRMPAVFGAEGLSFESALAANANEVLGLYEDRDDDGSSPALKEIEREFAAYQLAWEIVDQRRPEQREREAELAERVLLHYERRGGADRYAQARVALEGYFATSPEHPFRAAEDVTHFAQTLGIELRVTDPSSGTEFVLPLRGVLQLGEKKRSLPANALFLALARPTVWERIFDEMELGPIAQVDRAAFVSAGSLAAQKFLECRRRLRSILRQAATLAISRLGEAAWDARAIAEAKGLLLVATLVASGDFLVRVLDPNLVLDVEPRTVPSLARLRAIAARGALFDWMSGTFATRGDRAAETGERLAAVLARFQELGGLGETDALRLTAEALLETDRWLAKSVDEIVFGKRGTGSRTGTQWLDERQAEPDLIALRRCWTMFGLAAGPVQMIASASGGALPLATVLGERISRLSRGSLGGGRLRQGLDRLTTEYLETANDGDEDRAQRRTLLADLVRFGEKLRVLSGFQRLVDDGGQLYIDLLQAVANSLLTQADALQRREHLLDANEELAEHERDGRAAGERERVARIVAAPSDGSVPSAANVQASASARETLEGLASTLRYDLAVELARAGESARSKNLRTALEFVEEQLTRFVYLRHAAAYLRNAYPAPDLQTTPLHMQSRILGTEWNLPASRRKTAEQLDKQFWQSVNQIRLSGTGSTNYTLIKDDIGNWQVKAYEGDTRQLMQSLANLARFATQAGLSPAAVAGAAELSVLVDKVRGGKALGEDERQRMKELTAERAGASVQQRRLADSIEVAIAQGRELNADLRGALGKTLTGEPDRNALGEIAVAQAPAGPKQGEALLVDLQREFEALFRFDRGSLPSDEREEFRVRRLDQLRRIELELFTLVDDAKDPPES
ncbi:MAG: hypothetical protein IT457_19570, partial [Planctomycetes bacterium]|nr:hypothetical protein [Planctomycetota bacterium]